MVSLFLHDALPIFLRFIVLVSSASANRSRMFGLLASTEKETPGSSNGPGRQIYPGNDLLSHAVTSAVPSALEGLTSVFGMGTGVAPPVKSPGNETKRRVVSPPPNTEILECSQTLHLHDEE